MGVAKHRPVETEYAVPPTLKHVTAARMIAVCAPPAEMGSVPDRKTARPVPMIVGHARKNPPVGTGNAIAQKTVAPALGIVVGRVHNLRAPKDKVWTVMETVSHLRLTVRLRCLEESGQGLNVVVQVGAS